MLEDVFPFLYMGTVLLMMFVVDYIRKTRG